MTAEGQKLGQIPPEVAIAVELLKSSTKLSAEERSQIEAGVNDWVGDNEFRKNYVAAQMEPERGDSGGRMTRPETPRIEGRNNMIRSTSKKVG